jgi:hypothetical protein
MSWLRRKNDPCKGEDHDPYIDNAREALRNQDAHERKHDSRDEHAADFPRGVDSDFCYGEDSSPCA